MGIIAFIPGIPGHPGIIIIGKMPPFPASIYFCIFFLIFPTSLSILDYIILAYLF